jgi:hypothetical protein
MIVALVLRNVLEIFPERVDLSLDITRNVFLRDRKHFEGCVGQNYEVPVSGRDSREQFAALRRAQLLF